MTIAIDDNLILAIIVLFCLIFSILALDFPLLEARGAKNVPGEVWAHLRAMIFPFFAAISWYVFASYMVAAGNSGANLLFYFGYMMFFVYLVVGIVLVFYLALHPIVDVLEGRTRLD